MALRALWKGIITFGNMSVPVKLYAGLEDRTVHFRLLHRKDHQPVSQKMVSKETGREVSGQSMRKGVATDRGIVMLDEQELDELEPAASRKISIEWFVPPGVLGPQWYDRPYYLGPDGNEADYWNLYAAIGSKKVEGIGRWTMRGKEYIGVLRREMGCLVLITLRFAEQIIPPSRLNLPEFRNFEKEEMEMARQLVGMMAGDFKAGDYRDEYRQQLLQLIEAKKKGKKVKIGKPAGRNEPESLSGALQASLAAIRKKAHG
ncbi:MAG: Ku protein [Desulfobulbaceae bacterium]|nr:Ku protein [Desulfobulbaceae bacterium]